MQTPSKILTNSNNNNNNNKRTNSASAAAAITLTTAAREDDAQFRLNNGPGTQSPGDMQKHTTRGSQSPAPRAPVRRWNSFHGGNYASEAALQYHQQHQQHQQFYGGRGGGGGGELPQGLMYQEAYLGSRSAAPRLPRAVQALRSESVDRSHPARVQPPPPPAFPRRRFSVW